MPRLLTQGGREKGKKARFSYFSEEGRGKGEGKKNFSRNPIRRVITIYKKDERKKGTEKGGPGLLFMDTGKKGRKGSVVPNDNFPFSLRKKGNGEKEEEDLHRLSKLKKRKKVTQIHFPL